MEYDIYKKEYSMEHCPHCRARTSDQKGYRLADLFGRSLRLRQLSAEVTTTWPVKGSRMRLISLHKANPALLLSYSEDSESSAHAVRNVEASLCPIQVSCKNMNMTFEHCSEVCKLVTSQFWKAGTLTSS